MSLSVQFLSLLAMIGTGILAAAFIDMIGTGTAHAGKKSMIRRHAASLEVIGWIVAGCGTFYVLYIVRDGAWRIYDPFAQLSGIFLYASFFHKPFRMLGKIILVLVIRPLRFVVLAIVSLITFFYRLVWKVLYFLATPFIIMFRKLYSNLFKKREK